MPTTTSIVESSTLSITNIKAEKQINGEFKMTMTVDGKIITQNVSFQSDKAVVILTPENNNIYAVPLDGVADGDKLVIMLSN
jgi:hypothetical protein